MGVVVLLVLVATAVLAMEQQASRVVQFQNNLDQDVDVFWLNPDTKDKALISSVKAHAISSLNS